MTALETETIKDNKHITVVIRFYNVETFYSMGDIDRGSFKFKGSTYTWEADNTRIIVKKDKNEIFSLEGRKEKSYKYRGLGGDVVVYIYTKVSG